MKKKYSHFFLSIMVIISIACTSSEDSQRELRIFQTSFENISDFDGFYMTPQAHLNTSYHSQSDTLITHGTYAHKAWITGANPASTSIKNNNHRAYPCVQLYKTTDGSFTTPCYITFNVWLDAVLQHRDMGNDDWFSFATISCDESDLWERTILVNLSVNGHLHLMHTPHQGEQTHLYQNTSLTFPQKQWVEIKIYLDFRNEAYAKVWQDGVLVSHAQVENVENQIAQAHFGLYCPPQMTQACVFNDNLIVEMVNEE